jgi:hypothetical protein
VSEVANGNLPIPEKLDDIRDFRKIRGLHFREIFHSLEPV